MPAGVKSSGIIGGGMNGTAIYVPQGENGTGPDGS